MAIKSEGVRLIEQATAIFNRDVRAAYRSKDFNLTVRRSQEVVELALKGSLMVMGVDYPKIHDVAPVFSNLAKSKLGFEDQETLQEIERVSRWLVQARAPSFYLEHDYDDDNARRAMNDSKFVLDSIKVIVDLD